MAWTEEINKGRPERRQIHTLEVTPEPVCFPHAEQAAQLFRQIGKGKSEIVWHLTSRGSEKLDATQWLQANRTYWGIETGLHQRLDVSTNEDNCRVRNRNGIWVPGLFRRLVVSLFAEWKSQSPKRKYATLTDFQAQMGAEHAACAMRFVSARCPKFSRGS